MLRLEADWLFDGESTLAHGAVLLDGNRILEAGPARSIPSPENAQCHVFPGMTLLPGLVDTHAHITMPGDGTSVEDCANQGEALGLLRATANCRTALFHGVTTMAECGAPGTTAYTVKRAIEVGLIEGPRLFISGQALTPTGGHGWPFGGEVDGVDGVRAKVRQQFRDGADFIKVMASGGSTLRTRRDRPTFTAQELRALTDEAHSQGRKVVAHACNTLSIGNALDAGVDVMAHCAFTDPEPKSYVWFSADGPNNDFGAYRYQPELAQRLAETDTPVCPTMCTHRIRIQRLKSLPSLDTVMQAHLIYLSQRYAERCDYVRRLYELGISIIAGSDSGWSPPFGCFAEEVAALVDAGLPNAVALRGATRGAALALGLHAAVGALTPGMLADIIVTKGNPCADITALQRIHAVFWGGKQLPIQHC